LLDSTRDQLSAFSDQPKNSLNSLGFAEQDSELTVES
jgi:hypothetical protein